MVTEAPEAFCSVSHRFPSLAECVSPCGTAQVLWVAEAVSMLLSANASKASLCVRNQMAVVEIIEWICCLYQDRQDLLKREDLSEMKEKKRKQK